ncbi:unnamed protein product [Miscanthus lutarioriparius]|uniref:Uncharacterized protein n=1 Tax=Miscanthus lutarioriparius TaxID=422564 RepID=A0A811S3L6_9POAL|nr:unnamed protein product [Miscanthus lutarioriparius]
MFPSLEDLHIGECTLHLPDERHVEHHASPQTPPLHSVNVRTDDTKAAVTVFADDLRTLRMSCRWYSKTESPSEPLLFLCHPGITAVFSKYSLFRLCTPKLAVFEWRCCNADEVHVEAVGRLSDVAIEVDAGRKRTPTPIGTEHKYVTIQQRDKLVTDILQGLMPGLQPRTWKDVTSCCAAARYAVRPTSASTAPPSAPFGDTVPCSPNTRFSLYAHSKPGGVRVARLCYLDEVRIEAVGRLSEVTIEVDAGRTHTPTPIGTEPKYVTIQQRDKLVTDILQGLMPGLHPRTWKDVTRVKYPHVGKEFLPEADAGAYSLQLPPATVEQQVLRSAPFGHTVVLEDFPLAATVFLSLEDLHIGECTLTASMSVTSDTMPRLKHLRFTDVTVRTDDTKAAVTVLANDHRTLRMSCRWYSKIKSPLEPLLFLCHSGITAVFTKYSLFRLRAPKLAVFEWRCCYADEVRIEAVGRLSEVAIEVDGGRTRTPTPIGTEPKYVTIQQRDKLVTDFLQGLMPGLHPRTWKDVTSMSVTSDTMPRLKHLRFTDVTVRTDDTKSAVTVLADDLRTLRMSCRWYSKTESPSEPLLFFCHSGVTAVFTKYSLFRLRAPKLAVFEWRCCYADEVRIEAVGRLSDVAIEVDAGRTRTPTPIGPEPKYVTIQQRDKLVTDILQGLMPGLQPRTWKGVTRVKYPHVGKEFFPDADAGAWSLQLLPATVELQLAVFEWRCCYADEVRIEAVGRLSDVAIEVDAGRTRTPTPIGPEPKYVTIQQHDKPLTDILQGLMPGLQPRTWKDVTRVKYPHVGKEFLPDTDADAWSLQLPPATVKLQVLPFCRVNQILVVPHMRTQAGGFEWRCCYADEVRIEAVSRLSDVAIEVDAGRTCTPSPIGTEPKLQQRKTWKDVTRVKYPHVGKEFFPDADAGAWSLQLLPATVELQLAGFEWRCCYADEVRIEAVGRLSEVTIEVDGGRTRTPTPIGTEPKYVTIQQRDKLVTDILQGLCLGCIHALGKM